jgi:hypothetical protein
MLLMSGLVNSLPRSCLLYCIERPGNHFACRTGQKADGRRTLHQNPALTVAMALKAITTRETQHATKSLPYSRTSTDNDIARW